MHRDSRSTRRGFLRKTAAAVAGGLAFPFLAPTSSVFGSASRAAPSERVALGVIGSGHRARAVMEEFMAHADLQIVAVCDVKKWALDSAKARVDERYSQKGCEAYGDFRKLCERKDIDAALVGSTDNWHLLHSIAAVRSGKDVYMEKPMGVSMAECRALRDALRKHERIFQFGTQQRSDSKFRVACELARNEKIGKLQTIRVWSPGSSQGGSTEVVPVPAGLDYEMWLGPAPFKPHTRDRCENSTWWFVSDYALGFIAGWGIHPIDVAVWGGGSKLDGPIEIEGKGEFPKEGVCDTALNWRCDLRFANGVTLEFAGDPKPEEWTKRYPDIQSHGTAFEGTEGWVHVNRAAINSGPAGILQSKIAPEGVHLVESPGHTRNFLDSIKSRKPTVSNIDESMRSETLCQISDIAIRLGRKLKWDPKTETFPGDDEANRRLVRALRAPWTLA